VAGERIVILGPPGSGKGTQAARIAEQLGIAHLSTGDLLRGAVECRTELGRQAEEYMNRGQLVPDEVMIGLIREVLAGLDGWILDGFPRTLPQAEALAAMLAEQGQTIDHVLLIDVDAEVIVERLTSRMVCPVCNTVYNILTMRTKEDGKCDKCGADLVRRPDDEDKTVRRRLEVYEEQTTSVIDFYREAGLVRVVDGAGEIDEIIAEILRVLQ
jgi:adenylate kinase